MAQQERCPVCNTPMCAGCGDVICPGCGYVPDGDVIIFEAAPELDEAINADSDDYCGKYTIEELTDPAA